MGQSIEDIDIKGFEIHTDDEGMRTLQAACPQTSDDALYTWDEDEFASHLQHLINDMDPLKGENLTAVAGDGNSIAVGWENYDSQWGHDPTDQELLQLQTILSKYGYEPTRLHKDHYVYTST
jgi:hypothetical protein